MIVFYLLSLNTGLWCGFCNELTLTLHRFHNETRVLLVLSSGIYISEKNRVWCVYKDVVLHVWGRFEKNLGEPRGGPLVLAVSGQLRMVSMQVAAVCCVSFYTAMMADWPHWIPLAMYDHWLWYRTTVFIHAEQRPCLQRWPSKFREHPADESMAGWSSSWFGGESLEFSPSLAHDKHIPHGWLS